MEPENGEALSAMKVPNAPRPRSPLRWLLLVILVMAAAGVVFVVMNDRPQLFGQRHRATISTIAQHESPAPVSPSEFRLFYSIADYNGANVGSPTLCSVRYDGSDIRKHAHLESLGYCFFESISEDGNLVASTDGTDVNRFLYVSDIECKSATTIDEVPEGLLGGIIFSPDGTQVAYMRTREGSRNYASDLYLATVDGTKVKQLTHTSDDEFPIAFSDDGSKLVYRRYNSSKDKAETTMEMDLLTGESRKITTAMIPKRPSPPAKYTIVTRKTGKKIIMGVDGTEEEEDETFDDLYLTNPDTNERMHIAKAFKIVVLGWARK